MSRPKSGLARGVQITEFHEYRINPDPIISSDSDHFMDDFLSPSKLRALTGLDNLDDVQSLEMRVDTIETSLGNFGSYLPNLTHLKLSDSCISSIRDLGTSLPRLRVLWLVRCGLVDVDGLCSMPSLKEIYLAYNEISDLSPLPMLEALETLDLEGNQVDDIHQIEFLSLCPNLQLLTLQGNPICLLPSPTSTQTAYSYRQSVISILPQLHVLDDRPLMTSERPRRDSPKAPPAERQPQEEDEDDDEQVTSGRESVEQRATAEFDQDWELINRVLTETSLRIEDESLESGPGRPSSARPKTTRPVSALRPSTSGRVVTSSRGGPSAFDPVRPWSGRPGSSRPDTGHSDDQSSCDEASSLTMGSSMFGNPSKALRLRKAPNQRGSEESDYPVNRKQESPPSATAPGLDIDEKSNLGQVLRELHQWKEEQAILDKERADYFKPQILSIDQSDDTQGEQMDEGIGRSQEYDAQELVDDREPMFRPVPLKKKERSASPRRDAEVSRSAPSSRLGRPSGSREAVAVKPLSPQSPTPHPPSRPRSDPQASKPPIPPEIRAKMKALESNRPVIRPLSKPADSSSRPIATRPALKGRASPTLAKNIANLADSAPSSSSAN